MPYDFKNISPQDFQDLSRDLIERDLKVKLQSFKAGKDQGIDLLHSLGGTDEIVVQCKHYSRSTYAALKSSIRKEKAKVDTLNPKRYILVTSLPLSKLNKEELKALLEPHVRGLEDIYGQEQLNALLTNFGDIEKSHFKLWITSTTVLQSIINNGIFRGSQITLDKIARQVPLYVQNESFDEAKRILETEHVCVIAGNPGIGKTTLANMLSLKYLSEGFEFIQIQSDVREAKDVDSPQSKRIYYYDDFLGQTNLDQKLGKNEDQALLDFIEHVRNSENKRFILTTRQYILNQVKSRYEKIERDFDVKQCVIDLKKYTKYERAKILYNHVFFSSLSLEYREALLRDKAYLKIINHPNYNPRLLEYMTTRFKSDNNKSESYLENFLDTLDHPDRIWSEAFDKHLGQSAKTIAIVLLLLDSESEIPELQELFGSFQGQQVFGTDFRDGLKELEGNFIAIERRFSRVLISFQNPSVKDFLEAYVKRNNLLHKLISCARNFEQLSVLWDFASDQIAETEIDYFLEHLFKALKVKVDFQIATRIRLLLDILRKVKKLKQHSSTIVELLEWYESLGRTDIPSLAVLLGSMKDEGWGEIFSPDLKRAFRERLVEDLWSFDDISGVVENWENLNPWLLSAEDFDQIRQEFSNYASGSRLSEDIAGISEADDLKIFQNNFENVSQLIDEHLYTYEFEERLAEIKEKYEEENERWSRPDDWDDESTQIQNPATEDQAIENLFSTLLES